MGLRLVLGFGKLWLWLGQVDDTRKKMLKFNFSLHFQQLMLFEEFLGTDG